MDIDITKVDVKEQYKYVDHKQWCMIGFNDGLPWEENELSFSMKQVECKNVVFWMCRRVILVGTDVSEEYIASIFRMKTINELKTSRQ
jgi:hypothetical protein